MLSFVKLFEQLLKEIDVKNVGFFPGKFKPPHRGHFKTCEKACKENDLVLVLISSKEHEGVTAEESLKIWNIYGKYLKDSFPFIVMPTPVLTCFEIVNIINNGSFLNKEGKKPLSNAEEVISNNPILDSYINVGNNINVNLYSSPEDRERFKRMSGSLYKGKGVIDINYKPVERLTSASKFRSSIEKNQNIVEFLPDCLSDKDKKLVINILKNDNI